MVLDYGLFVPKTPRLPDLLHWVATTDWEHKIRYVRAIRNFGERTRAETSKRFEICRFLRCLPGLEVGTVMVKL